MKETRHGNDLPILEVQNLGKTFKMRRGLRVVELRALNDVSFRLSAGKTLALVGESGSGKSTILRLLTRLLSPGSGRILFRGKDLLAEEPKRASLEYRSAVQMIFQDPFGSLNPAHRVDYHLRRPLVRHRKGAGASALGDRIDELLTTVGLTPTRDFARKFPHEMSGGQRQRVAIARALAADPQVLLADEPISMLDVSIRMGILNLLQRLKQERHIACLYVTHDVASARYIGDATMVMYAGHVVEQGPSDEITSKPLHPYTRLLLEAVPDPSKGKRPLPVATRLPNLVNPASGCRFAGRCPETRYICRTVVPELVRVEGERFVRCHLYSHEQTDPSLPEGQPGL